MARPSTYNPDLDFEKLVDDYLQTCGREQTKLPKISQFCREYLHASEDAVADWLKLKDQDTTRLSGAIKKVKDLQKEELMDDGLFGGKEVNAAMAIFLLKANHGLIETEKRILAGDENKPVEIKIVSDDTNRITNIELPKAAVDISESK